MLPLDDEARETIGLAASSACTPDLSPALNAEMAASIRSTRRAVSWLAWSGVGLDMGGTRFDDAQLYTGNA
jgi:hypothetical protein